MILATLMATALYAIVGGPSNGKTSIIEALKAKGELTAQEVASEYIMEQIDQGVQEPWNQDFFQYNILKRHIQREEELISKADQLKKGRAFTDRGILDHYVYLALRNKQGTEEYKLVDQIIQQQQKYDHYKAVFFVHPHAGKYECEQNKVRHEDNDEMRRINEMTYAIYCKCPIFIEVPPHMTPQERAEFVLNKIALLE